MKAEEDEIYKIISICLDSNATIITNCINRLKKYDPEKLTTYNKILKEDNTSIKDLIEKIVKEPDENDDFSKYSVINNKLFYITMLYMELNLKKEYEERLLENLTESFIKEENIEITPEEKNEIIEGLKEYLKENDKL
ncbi:hypothetical protein PXD04_08295 [Methanosphaera sp. ISO3-F5]|uniref:hypothetical protein n=1 Tax=Methanosphaera sp. ISO3-F5 TaxID=1452353 RepID=UPI002B26042A|nr:hypothetical protein [Methanosphaera sp. ISO3-F5]WQH63693.1 hypothetical protein PXD04_08295 [Methanosphaera sp. ISO3-F5]